MKTKQEKIEQVEKVLKNEQIRIANTVDGFKELTQKGVCYCYAKAIVEAGYGELADGIKQAQIDVLNKVKKCSYCDNDFMDGKWHRYVFVSDIDELIEEIKNDKCNS